MKVLHLICNSHIDLAWMWSYDEGASTALSTFYAAVDIAKDYDYIFCHNEVVLYEYIEKYYPELFTEIKRLVKEGKWHIMGGWYLQPDCNLPSGESFVRQIGLGRKYFKEKFGIEPTVAVNFDSFGHTKGLVQILKKTGYDGYIFCRPMPELMPLDDPYFIWKGYDGSKIKAYRSIQKGLYATGLGRINKALEEYSKKWEELGKDVGVLLWGMGNHGGILSRKDLDAIKEFSLNADYKVVHSTPERFFAEISPSYVYDGDLRPCFIKAYSSMSRVKKKHAEIESKLFMTEKLCSLAAARGKYDYNFSAFERAEKTLATIEFHDVLAGTCDPQGERDTLQKADFALEILNEEFLKAFFALVKDHKEAAAETFPVFVFNPNAYETETVVETEFLIPEASLHETHFKYVKVKREGKVLPSQIIKELSNINYERRKRVAFKCKLPPLDIARFDIEIDFLPKKTIKENIDEDIVVSDVVKKVVIDRQSGLIKEFSVGGKNYLCCNAFLPVLYCDNADPWGWDMETLGKDPSPMQPYADNFAAFKGLNHLRIIEQGDVVTEVESLFVGGSSAARIGYKIYKDLPYIDVFVTVFYNENEKILKLKIPTALGGEYYTQQAFGINKENADGKEKPMHRFLMKKCGDKVLAIYNDGVYSVSYDGGDVYLTLLNGSAYCAHPIGDRPLIPSDRFVPHIEQGKHEFSFRVAIENADCVWKNSAAFCCKPYGLNCFPHGNGEFPTKSVNIIGNVCLEAFKKLDDNLYALRLFNPTEHIESATISVLNAEISIGFAPFEVKTFVFGNGKLIETETMLS